MTPDTMQRRAANTAAGSGASRGGWHGIRARVHLTLETTRASAGANSTINWALLVLILLNVVALVLETVPALAPYMTWFHAFELVSVIVFSVEYLARVWSSVEDPRFAGGLVGRLRYMATPMALIDLAAILPSLLTVTSFDFRFLRVLRLFRVIRVARLARYSTALQTFGFVISRKRAEIIVLLGLLSVLVLCSSSVMYFIERDAQPATFSSIPAAMWWAVVTLTTIGYGDATPLTPLGRFVGSLVAVFGIGIFALPAGMLGAAFSAALTERNAEGAACPRCGYKHEGARPR